MKQRTRRRGSREQRERKRSDSSAGQSFELIVRFRYESTEPISGPAAPCARSPALNNMWTGKIVMGSKGLLRRASGALGWQGIEIKAGRENRRPSDGKNERVNGTVREEERGRRAEGRSRKGSSERFESKRGR